MTLYTDTLDSPVGILLVAATDHALCAIGFEARRDHYEADLARRFPDSRRKQVADPGGYCSRLSAYFDGDRDAFAGVAFDGGGTPFQRQVWRALCDIPYGETASYRDIAVAVGRPKAVRAVGMTNGRNPISIAVPCHRVIGASGKLVGYGGGLENKLWLLDHETSFRLTP